MQIQLIVNFNDKTDHNPHTTLYIDPYLHGELMHVVDRGIVWGRDNVHMLLHVSTPAQAMHIARACMMNIMIINGRPPSIGNTLYLLGAGYVSMFVEIL